MKCISLNQCMVKIANLNTDEISLQWREMRIKFWVCFQSTSFDRFMKFGYNLTALSFRARKIFSNTPTIIGATILDLARYQMYSFHYYTMRAPFDCRLLYSDTDCLLYKIRSGEFYEEPARKPVSVASGLDFSNYPNDHCLYSTKNKRVVLKRDVLLRSLCF